MTEHCHLLGTVGMGAQLGMGTRTRHGHPQPSRTPLPAVTLQGREQEALGDGPWDGGGCRVTGGRVAVAAGWLHPQPGARCSVPAQHLPPPAPNLWGRPQAFQPEEKKSKNPSTKQPGAMLGRRAGYPCLLGTAGSPPPSPTTWGN